MAVKRFLAIVILNLYEIVCLAAEQHGVEYIQEGWKYNYWIRTGGGTLSGFGYELQPGRPKYDYSHFTIDSWETTHERALVESWKDNSIVTIYSFAFPAEFKTKLDELIIAEEISARETLAGLALDVAASSRPTLCS